MKPVRGGGRRFAALAALVVVLSACTSCGAEGGDGHPEGDAVRVAGEYGQVVSTSVGMRFTDASLPLYVRTDSPITLLSVESIGGSGSAKFLGAKVADDSRVLGSFQTFDRWPPGVRELAIVPIDASGAVIPPRDETRKRIGYTLLLGYRVTHARFGVRTGVRLVYRQGTEVFEQTLPAHVVFCPQPQKQPRCLDRATE